MTRRSKRKRAGGGPQFSPAKKNPAHTSIHRRTAIDPNACGVKEGTKSSSWSWLPEPDGSHASDDTDGTTEVQNGERKNDDTGSVAAADNDAAN
eukprot:CAMPEP_0197181730 /NCGR_PEP_ID=MMETSP1423-20130617/5927_1 /TAXON_ID=476441 /ORGANISM="Pseudo-nitzschia heimii, Strain UNC1101" /LENGTH=93 /DNA_ID=CAMNT_0042632033 /DNA_START=51 /DNA_END=329 /DNA_ORIENTATION=+